MEEIEILKKRLEKATEIFKTLKAELAEKSLYIEELENKVEELSKKLQDTENSDFRNIEKQAKMTSEIRKIRTELETNFDIFE